MGSIKEQKFICPKCGHEFTLKLMDELEVPYDKQWKRKVINNTFFTICCPECKMVLPVDYQCVYNDLEKQFMVWLAPNPESGDQEKIDAYNQRLKEDSTLRLARGGFTFRAVRTSTELREKVLIFDAGLDDRVIELMKITYVPSVLEKCEPDCKIVGFYFDWRIDDKGGQWMIVFDKCPPMMAPFDKKDYEAIEKKYKKAIEKHTGEGIVWINAKWASDVMMNSRKKK